MTELIHREGNIFDTDAVAIAQGVNTVGVMGAGIAKQFRANYPQMYEQYKIQCEKDNLEPGGLMVYVRDASDVTSPQSHIYNIASQDNPGPNARYDWLMSGLQKAIEDAMFRGIHKIAIPRIGSGIGGLDEAEVEKILLELAEAGPVDIELWTYRP